MYQSCPWYNWFISHASPPASRLSRYLVRGILKGLESLIARSLFAYHPGAAKIAARGDFVAALGEREQPASWHTRLDFIRFAVESREPGGVDECRVPAPLDM